MAPTRTLILIRHAKSDWSGDHADEDRPLARRGLRQAAEAGRWLAQWSTRSAVVIETAVVSPARRAHRTWELVAAELAYQVTVDVRSRVYTFAGHELVDVVRGLPAELGCVALVGHNPAMADLVLALTGEVASMPTSAVAVVRFTGDWSRAARRPAQLITWGRPPATP
ncbi:MAG: SixA phosphatase family protein [Nocardioides sp.]